MIDVPAELETFVAAGDEHPAIRQTHISTVILAADRAYKRLKPVRFDFLDFSTREARYVHLASEARLNRRLAADVYRRLVPIWRQGRRWSFAGSGPPDDWMLEMLRLPDDSTLEAAVRTGTLTQDQLDDVLDLLTRFFGSARCSESISANGDPAVLRRNFVENFDVLDAAAKNGARDASRVLRLRSVQLQALVRLEQELRSRLETGWIRDGHGDLRAEHVYLTQPVAIIDCIAFNHRLRWIDTADDISFLAADLIRLDAALWADRLLEGYRQRLGDPISDRLLALYRSYRFAVRAKVSVLRGREAGDGQHASQQAAEQFLDRAIDELTDLTPWLVAVCGLSGTGKTTVATALAERIGGVHLSSDRVRKELFGLPPTSRAGGQELYTEAANDRTYAELLLRAERLVQGGISVVLDATFVRRADRDELAARADSRSLRPLFVECRCSESEIERRIADRTARGDAVSDANLDVWRRQRSVFDGYAGLPVTDHVVVDSTQSPGATLDEIVSRLKDR